MKTNRIAATVFSGIFLASAGASFAASVTLTNGGLGQIAAEPQEFAVVVCNGGGQTVTASVPVAVTVGTENATVQSPASIASGQCGDSYINYAQLGMQIGEAYSVNVTIDPQHTIITNSNNEATYEITVPGQVAVVNNTSSNNDNLTADISVQATNPIVSFWDWLLNLFRKI